MNQYLKQVLVVPLAAATLGMSAIAATIQSAAAQSAMYNPIRMPASNEVTDTLSDRDIPTGFGGFARDYVVTLEAGDNVVIDVTSDEFDTIITLIGPDGAAVGENDDGPDGTTNSMLFFRVTNPGSYVLRVRPFGGQGTGSFDLKVTRLRPV